MEGQRLPEVEPFLFTPDRWNINQKRDWSSIHEIWNAYWQPNIEFAIEKSPSNCLHITDIRNQFQPLQGIILVRHPYAIAESLLRRNAFNIEQACCIIEAAFTALAKAIKQNEDFLVIRYEDVIASHHDILKQVEHFIPRLGKLKSLNNSASHNLYGNQVLKNSNRKKLQQLKETEIAALNSLMQKHDKSFQLFKYSTDEKSMD